jgi:HD superfamily phosphodiesterase
MTEADRYELKIAGLLHDCGKVTTPVHVVDKATKLETIHDRIELVDTRIEILQARRTDRAPQGPKSTPRRWPSADAATAVDDREFLRRANIGGSS